MVLKEKVLEFFVKTPEYRKAEAKAERAERDDRKAWAARIDDLKRELTKELPPLHNKVAEATAGVEAIDRQREKVIETWQEARSARHNFVVPREREIAQLERSLYETADSRIDEAKERLHKMWEQERHLITFTEETSTMLGRQVTATDGPSKKRRIMAILRLGQDLDQLKLHVDLDIAEEIEKAISELPVIEMEEIKDGRVIKDKDVDFADVPTPWLHRWDDLATQGE